MHHSSVEGVEDMAKLGDLHESAILHNLKLRYEKDQIYVSIIVKPPSPWRVNKKYGVQGLVQLSVKRSVLKVHYNFSPKTFFDF